jgi:murein DD-endopeptidase MepM/ murein hydrolase activator NlpD
MPNRHLPAKYTIFLTRTGKPPLVLHMSPRILLARVLCGLGFLSIPFALAGSTWWAEQQRNSQYLEERVALQQRQEQLQIEQEQLQQEIDRLRERAGLPKADTTPLATPDTNSKEQNQGQNNNSNNNPRGRGGASNPDQLIHKNQSRLNSLWSQIRVLNPTLEATLSREEVTPLGMPMQGGNLEITSLFGNRPNPFGSGNEIHNGMDFVDAYASPVYATAPGIVTSAGFDGGYGLVVTISHSYGYSTLYAHLSGLAIKQDARVKRGQLIGYLGNSGRSTGPHLHYSIYQGEKAIDPQPYLKLTTAEFQKLSNPPES